MYLGSEDFRLLKKAFAKVFGEVPEMDYGFYRFSCVFFGIVPIKAAEFRKGIDEWDSTHKVINTESAFRDVFSKKHGDITITTAKLAKETAVSYAESTVFGGAGFSALIAAMMPDGAAHPKGDAAALLWSAMYYLSGQDFSLALAGIANILAHGQEGLLDGTLRKLRVKIPDAGIRPIILAAKCNGERQDRARSLLEERMPHDGKVPLSDYDVRRQLDNWKRSIASMNGCDGTLLEFINWSLAELGYHPVSGGELPSRRDIRGYSKKEVWTDAPMTGEDAEMMAEMKAADVILSHGFRLVIIPEDAPKIGDVIHHLHTEYMRGRTPVTKAEFYANKSEWSCLSDVEYCKKILNGEFSRQSAPIDDGWAEIRQVGAEHGIKGTGKHAYVTPDVVGRFLYGGIFKPPYPLRDCPWGKHDMELAMLMTELMGLPPVPTDDYHRKYETFLYYTARDAEGLREKVLAAVLSWWAHANGMGNIYERLLTEADSRLEEIQWTEDGVSCEKNENIFHNLGLTGIADDDFVARAVERELEMRRDCIAFRDISAQFIGAFSTEERLKYIVYSTGISDWSWYFFSLRDSRSDALRITLNRLMVERERRRHSFSAGELF